MKNSLYEFFHCGENLFFNYFFVEGEFFIEFLGF